MIVNKHFIFSRSTQLLIFFLLVLLTVSVTFAQDASPKEREATPDPTKVEKVKELKEKLATKVATLRENQKRGLYGEIMSLGKSSFTLVVGSSEVKVNFDEDVVIYDLTDKRTQKEVSILKNSQVVSVLGYFDEGQKQQQAKVIFIQTLPIHFWGEISSIDKTKGTITVKQKDDQATFDYERSTTADEYSLSDKKLKKSGLSRLVIGDYADLWTTANKEGTNRTTVRLLRFPKELFSQDVRGEVTAATASAEPAESPAASPKTKASAKATPKAIPTENP